MPDKMIGNEYRSTLVCVDSYENSVLVGRIFNPYLSGAVPFQSLIQFLLQMEDLLNEMHFPQPFAETRTFSPSGEHLVRADNRKSAPEGKLATFSIKVIFRQNSSWQGSVTWLNQGREESFRSALELILLLDSALDAFK